MPDANELTKAMKRAAMNAVDASKPVNIYFGKVVSASPLQINVEQKMVLGKAQLVLSRNVTDFTTMITVQWDTEDDTEHSHKITGKKEVKMHNALKAGDEVILVRQQEGQKYVVIDRIGVI